jgi:cytochrome c556
MIIFCLLFSSQVYSEDFRALSLERRQAFTNIEDNLDLVIDKAEEKEINWEEMLLISQDLNEEILFLKQSFPNKSYKNTRARERIWNNLEDFEKRFTELAVKIENIDSGVKKKNRRSVIESWDEAGDTCNACHRRYRTFW